MARSASSIVAGIFAEVIALEPDAGIATIEDRDPSASHITGG
jgi:hypothetical protein